jgi:hypothetical protein
LRDDEEFVEARDPRDELGEEQGDWNGEENGWAEPAARGRTWGFMARREGGMMKIRDRL